MKTEKKIKRILFIKGILFLTITDPWWEMPYFLMFGLIYADYKIWQKDWILLLIIGVFGCYSFFIQFFVKKIIKKLENKIQKLRTSIDEAEYEEVNEHALHE